MRATAPPSLVPWRQATSSLLGRGALGVQEKCTAHLPMQGSGWEAGHTAATPRALHKQWEHLLWARVGWGVKGQQSALSGDRERLSGRGGVEWSLVQFMGVPSLGRWTSGGGCVGEASRTTKNPQRPQGEGDELSLFPICTQNLVPFWEELSFPIAQKCFSHTDGQQVAIGRA